MKTGIGSLSGYRIGVNVNDNERLEHEAHVKGTPILKNSPKRQRYKTGKTSGTIQKYTKFSTANGVYFQANPGTHPNPMIMIKENEAGTIYLRKGATIPEQLVRLGINVISDNIQDPLDTIIHPPVATPKFYQIRQGRITPSGLPPQPLRTHESKNKVLDMLQRQLRFLNRLNGFLPLIRNELNLGNQANLTAISDSIRILLDRKTGNLDSGFHKTRRRTIGALGMDIINAAFALYEIASEQIFPPQTPAFTSFAAHYTTVNEKLQVIDALESDILLRIDQVCREIETAEYEPVIRTGCDVSAEDRSLYIHPDRERQQADFNKGPFQKTIGWAYHYASQINVGNLTTDTLFIEDAVGKSSGANEMANAHWFARLYGSQQSLPEMHPVGHVLTPIVGAATQIEPAPFVPVNKFNNLASGVKEAFFTQRGLKRDDSWTIWYVDDRAQQSPFPHGKLVITIDSNFNFQYKFQARPNQILTASMQDFMIQTANNVIDGMLIEEFAHCGYLRRMGLSPATTTQDIRKQMRTRFVKSLDSIRYKLEDF